MPVYPFFYFTPGTCAEQTTLPHSYAHGFKPMKRNDKTQFILPYMRPHRRIKQAKKGAASLIPVFLHGKRYHRRTSRTEHGSHGIRRIVVIECPGTQTGKYIGSGKKQKSFGIFKTVVYLISPHEIQKLREFGIILKQNQLSCMFNGISLQCFRLIVIKAICCQCRNKIH